jgi:glycosyltransferase involved in cell wall biosynthesis
MITVVYCTKTPNQKHIDHIIKSSGLHKHIEVIEIINNSDSESPFFNGGLSLTKAYNQGLKQAKNEIVVFCHDDIEIETKQWGTKLLKQFKRNSEYAIIGVAGSKNIPVSGRWWEDQKKMYGRVKHTKDGKSWLSAYSDDLGQELEEVVNIDGVFFAAHKGRIKQEFNESVEGFHFYDVTFSFENYLSGVKVGVSTLIKINHHSIGITNDEWEKNRADFAHNFAPQLPADIKRTLRKGEKLNILIGCLSFSKFTGSELYVLELAKGLLKQNCEVSIWSQLDSPLKEIAHGLGIKTYDISTPPTFKRGDGKWLVSTPDGEIPSVENTLYKVSNIDYDVIHSNHKPITENLARLFPNVPIITTIHSEVIDLEEPFICDNIKKYIAIRPEIKEHLINKFKIDEKDIDVIYNPIDTDRFKVVDSKEKRTKKRTLFVGTIDYLRAETIIDLVNITKNQDEELWLVGAKLSDYLDDLLLHNPHVKYFPPTNKPEQYIHQCDETAGIMLGRTTIEGWLCGKKGWIYDVDSKGHIISKTLHEIPEDISKFNREIVVTEIKELYNKLI